ncbi:MAG: hypothetical protein EOO53_01765 [Gammaproteobacteria bacterium]|nr:MAG: hypothetical protein EOO53_01765 [Gammaproteobacteria bacterium]
MMNSKVLTTQFKREFWENKISFLVTPALVSALILLVIICASLFSGSLLKDGSFHFTYNSADESVQSTPSPENGPKLKINDSSQTVAGAPFKKIDAVTSVMSEPGAFDSMVMGSMYVNCAFLYLIFSIVMASYSLRCLFDDRKNKDILFWRSMPLSETTNVLVKLAMVVLAAPIIMLALNMLITVLSILIGFVFFGYIGVKMSFLLASIVHGKSLYIPFQIFYELVISLLVSLPVIGFAFFVSALSKKAPFLMFASPALLALADLSLRKFFGLNIGFIDLLSVYFGVIVQMKSAFILQESFSFDHAMILPFISCLAVGGLFVAAAIWLRNNRYEI